MTYHHLIDRIETKRNECNNINNNIKKKNSNDFKNNNKKEKEDELCILFL